VPARLQHPARFAEGQVLAAVPPPAVQSEAGMPMRQMLFCADMSQAVPLPLPLDVPLDVPLDEPLLLEVPLLVPLDVPLELLVASHSDEHDAVMQEPSASMALVQGPLVIIALHLSEQAVSVQAQGAMQEM
jgi:hypothetical protein